jgi:hypothetical protein
MELVSPAAVWRSSLHPSDFRLLVYLLGWRLAFRSLAHPVPHLARLPRGDAA